ncbi:MAG: 50S ribosomal protein L28 [Chloroflexi bacterium]|nr:50S ribosomal protein L28 [Chloroflexota bacterium]
MASKCEICGKGIGHGHNVSHSKRRTNRIWRPNVHPTHMMIGGVLRRINSCTRCLRTARKVQL